MRFKINKKLTLYFIFKVKVKYNNENFNLNLFDTAGQEEWDTLRKMAYPGTDVIILCFSVIRPDSMSNILSKWIIEINKFIPNALIVLVGTQVDLRSETASSEKSITTREGEELRQCIKAFKYIECSALTQKNIKEVFDACIEAYQNFAKKEQQTCFQSLLTSFSECLSRRINFRRNSTSLTSSNSKLKYHHKH